MKRLILVTVGTSLRGKEALSQGVKSFIENLERRNDIAATTTDVFNGEYKGQTEREESALKYLEGRRSLTDLTAEIASLKLMSLDPENDQVVLLCSDTPDGVFCARVNAAYINKHMVPVEQAGSDKSDVQKIEGLEVGDPKRFKVGLEHLYLHLEEYAKIAKQAQRELLINITGGYKGAIPFIAVFAYLNQHTLVYFHEEGSLLLRIEPAIPEPGSSSSLKVTIEQKTESKPKPEVYLCPTS